MIHLICPNPAIDRTLLLETIENAVPNRPIEVKEFPGGKSFNVAYALSYEEDSPQVTIHTMLGGIYGEHLRNLAQTKGYRVRVTNVEKNTRMCNILVDVKKKEIVPIYENGFDLNPEILEEFTINLINSIKDGDLIVFSGSLMKGMPQNYICQIEKNLLNQKKSFKLCIDTSGETLRQTYLHSNPYLVKINDEEIKDIFPEKKLETIDDYLSLLANDIKANIPNFIITLGKVGVVGRMNDKLFFGNSEPVDAKNPIACGDFFLGRLVKGIFDGRTAEESLKSALLFSTCNAMNWYPEVTDRQMKSIYHKITVKKMNRN